MDRVGQLLSAVNDPELHKDLVSLGMVKDIAVDGFSVRVHIELTTPACPLREQIKRHVEREVMLIDGVKTVEVRFSARMASSRPDATVLPGVKNVVAVGAGKGAARARPRFCWPVG